MAIVFLIRSFFKTIGYIFFKKGELEVSTPKFNPTKFFFIMILMAYLILATLAINRMASLYIKIDKICPSIINIAYGSVDAPHYEQTTIYQSRGRKVICTVEIITVVEKEEK